MPEHTGVTLMSENITIRKELVVDDRPPLIAEVMVLNKGHSGLGLLLQNSFPRNEIVQTESVLIA
jgi:hypothetical protein